MFILEFVLLISGIMCELFTKGDRSLGNLTVQGKIIGPL